MAKKRTNVIPIIEDARKPQNYRFMMGMVDVVFSDVSQQNQTRIMALNCKHYLRDGGMFMISIKAGCIDSTKEPNEVFMQEVGKMKQEGLTPKKIISLEPYHKGHSMVIGYYRSS